MQRVNITKDNKFSDIIGENISVYLDDKEVNPYIMLLSRVFPKTKIEVTKFKERY